MNTRTLALSLSALCALSACDDDQSGGTGSMELTAYGEEYLDYGINAPDMADGWTITFESFKVTVREVEIAGELWTTGNTVDMTQGSAGSGVAFGKGDFPSGTHDSASFILGERSVSGRASKGSEEKRFNWRFTDEVHYQNCDTTVRVPIDSQGVFEVTLWVEKLFANSLSNPRAPLYFGPLAAADANNDGSITQAELQATALPSSYESDDANITSLWGFIAKQSQVLVRANGEGRCQVVPL